MESLNDHKTCLLHFSTAVTSLLADICNNIIFDLPFNRLIESCHGFINTMRFSSLSYTLLLLYTQRLFAF